MKTFWGEIQNMISKQRRRRRRRNANQTIVTYIYVLFFACFFANIMIQFPEKQQLVVT
jgi:hypothetical protein